MSPYYPNGQAACFPSLLDNCFLILNGSRLVFTGEGIKKWYKLGGTAVRKSQIGMDVLGCGNGWVLQLQEIGGETENYIGSGNITVKKDLTNKG